jgi:hypothetical protein
MRTRSKLLLAALAAALLLAAHVGGASAALSVNERGFRIAWARFEVALANEFTVEAVRCPVTLEGSFHSSTWSSLSEAQVGQMTRSSVGLCTGGTLTVLAEALPWALRYVSTFGFPMSLRMSYIPFSMQVATARHTCLTRATLEEPARAVWRTDASGNVTVAGDQNINLPVTGTGCTGLRFSYEGLAAATRAGSTSSLVVRTI